MTFISFSSSNSSSNSSRTPLKGSAQGVEIASRLLQVLLNRFLLVRLPEGRRHGVEHDAVRQLAPETKTKRVTHILLVLNHKACVTYRVTQPLICVCVCLRARACVRVCVCVRARACVCVCDMMALGIAALGFTVEGLGFRVWGLGFRL